MHIHILGICGTFMGGIAAIAKQAGYQVTGCDQNIYPPMSDQLLQLGIDLHQGFDAEQIDKFKPDTIVIGNIMTRGMPIIERLLQAKSKLVSGPQWLAEHVLNQQNHVIAAAGTHGKTTTSSLAAWILEDNGLNPGFLIGGVPQNFSVSARAGGSKVFVIEADEYDTAFFDKRSKFIHYRPDIAILNNLEFDHADIFDSLSDIERQFHHLIKLIPMNGHVLVNGDDRNLTNVLDRGCWSNLEQFGKDTSDYRVKFIDNHQFEISYLGQVYTAESVLPGEHNQMNLMAAIAACHKVGVDFEAAIISAKKFKPPKRRLELKYNKNSVRVFDDFAHHPTAIEETIKAIKADKKLIVAFEPRSNSMRSGAHSAGLRTAFVNADEIILYQPQTCQTRFNSLKQDYPQKLHIFDSIDKIIEHLKRSVVENTDVVFMSNGSFENIITKYIQTL